MTELKTGRPEGRLTHLLRTAALGGQEACIRPDEEGQARTIIDSLNRGSVRLAIFDKDAIRSVTVAPK